LAGKVLRTVNLDPGEVKMCNDFASRVVGETYNRFSKGIKERRERIFLDKLGETTFFGFLTNNGKRPITEGMFDVYVVKVLWITMILLRQMEGLFKVEAPSAIVVNPISSRWACETGQAADS
jgi:hypothetical protein